ncbi:antitoxin VapB family protein [Halorutilales archaeon Cl-col2-1]
MTTIRVSEETKKRLEMEKRENESFDDVILRLTDRDKWQGFGALEGGKDSKEGMQKVREEFSEEMDRDVEEMEQE